MQPRIQALIVEDDPSIRALLRTLLEDVAEVTEAPNGVIALTRAWETRPNLIVLDREMPVMGGEEAAPYLRIMAPGAVIVAFSASLDATPLWADLFVDKSDAIALVELAGLLQPQALGEDVLEVG